MSTALPNTAEASAPPAWLQQLPPQQREALDALRAAFDAALPSSPNLQALKLSDDQVLLRFLIARKLDVNKALSMLQDTANWRVKSGAELEVFPIVGAPGPELAPKDALLPIAVRGFQSIRDCNAVPKNPEEEKMFSSIGGVCVHKWDKEGHPIFIDRLGLLDTHSYSKHVSYETLEHIHLRTQEMIRRVLMPELTRRFRTRDEPRVDKLTAIFDMSGLTISQFNISALMMVRHTGQLDMDNYPESLRRAFFVNCPPIFTKFQAFGKKWVDAETFSKVQFHTRGPEQTRALLEAIDAENLPAFLGGQCYCTSQPGGCSPSLRLDRREYFYPHVKDVSARNEFRVTVSIPELLRQRAAGSLELTSGPPTNQYYLPEPTCAPSSGVAATVLASAPLVPGSQAECEDDSEVECDAIEEGPPSASAAPRPHNTPPDSSDELVSPEDSTADFVSPSSSCQLNKKQPATVDPSATDLRMKALSLSDQQSAPHLTWHFMTVQNNIRFGVFRVTSAGTEVPVVDPAMVDSHVDPVKGSIAVDPDSTYILSWDNSSSYFTGKTVYFNWDIVPGAK
ncbi:hypothetical protein H696_00618 [Fonticula alba]|uniref:CRAL-TRIO domain-containing protein n=1 Tax=Fonticula alba TaxID=691883 RepID=A0A058ZHT9_FONAL|nr:hypothetical protein H696_00618 [Fonticula alba]KCV73072.1 hypothetical protein H696_00618 [Fonticula alba]|eukprot:XP_009492773.1 hypothetical protein H696_00618 [Fonticula alba]